MRLLPVFAECVGMRQDLVREMVILVNEKIELQAHLLAFVASQIQHTNGILGRLHLLWRIRWKQMAILIAKQVEHSAAIAIHLLLIMIKVGMDSGEVQGENQILVALRGWMATYI